jgi:hypothetical protein
MTRTELNAAELAAIEAAMAERPVASVGYRYRLTDSTLEYVLEAVPAADEEVDAETALAELKEALNEA